MADKLKEELGNNDSRIHRRRHALIEDEPSRRTYIQRNKKLFAFCILTILVVAIVLVSSTIHQNMVYNSAVTCMIEGEYDKAVLLFSDIKNARKKEINRFVFEHTDTLCAKDEYKRAESWLIWATGAELISKTERENLKKLIEYHEAIYLSETGEYTSAYYRFIRLGDYSDSAARAIEVFENHKDAFYELAVSNFNSLHSSEVKQAKKIFEMLDSYEDCNEYLEKIAFFERMNGTYRDDHDTIFGRVTTTYLLDYGYIEKCDRYSDIDNLGKMQIIEYDNAMYAYVPIEKEDDLVLHYRNDILYIAHVDNWEDYVQDPENVFKNQLNQFWKISNSTDGLRKPRIGMSSQEVFLSSWGEPYKVNKHTYSWGVSEQWCYPDHKYIYLDDGIVTSISE